MLRILHCLESQLTDGGEVVSLMHCALSPEISSGTHFCYRLSKPQGHGVTGRIR
jgi:hypothetical protein